MKKLISLVLCLVLALALVPAMAEGTLRTGLSAVVSVTPTDATENKDGQIRSDVTIAAVALNEAGVIVDCKIDAYRADITFNAKGELTQDLTTTFQTKNELGDAYGMNAIAPKGEWNVQAAGFAAYCIGKTREEIKGINVEEGKATDEDILATTTISIGDFVEAVARAVDEADDHGAKEGDTLYLTATANMHSSKSATENKDGAAQLDATYAAITVKDDVITSIIIDAVQPKAGITIEGKAADVPAPEDILSKLEKGDNYGMQPASSLEKGEWYQQMEGFDAYVTGKTLAEATGIAVGEDGKTTDADLAATTTISIADFIILLNKVAQ